MELSQLCTILGAAQSSNPQQRKAAEQTLLQVTLLVIAPLHLADHVLHAHVLVIITYLGEVYRSLHIVPFSLSPVCLFSASDQQPAVTDGLMNTSCVTVADQSLLKLCTYQSWQHCWTLRQVSACMPTCGMINLLLHRVGCYCC